jgi:hypothetical protein
MTKTSVDASTGNLIVSGKRVFPIGLSDPPPLDGVAPESGLNAWAEIASAGVTFTRNYTVWTNAAAAEQILSVAQQLDAAAKHGLQLWLALAGVDNDLSHQSLLNRVVNTLKGHPGLGAWSCPGGRPGRSAKPSSRPRSGPSARDHPGSSRAGTEGGR